MSKRTDNFEFTLSLAKGFMPQAKPSAMLKAKADRQAAPRERRDSDSRPRSACG